MMERRGTPDFFLLLMTFLFVGFGIVMVFSASAPVAAYEFGDNLFFTKKQLVSAALGTFLMFILMNIPYTKLKKGYLPFFLGVLGLLFLVLLQPSDARPKSWIDLGMFSIQPAEFAKLAIILYLASLITKKGENFSQFRKGLLPVALVVGFVGGLILLQPDFGTFIVFLCCSTIVIVTGGANLRHLLMGATSLGAAAVVLIGGQMLAGELSIYQMKRFDCFVNPWQDPQNWCYQHVQAEMAFGHGGVGGVGFGQSVQKLFYLPEAQNDYIFAIIGEELGLIGSSIFLLLFLAFLWRGIVVSLRCPDMYGTIVGVGIVGMFGIQAFINIGGVIRAIPMTGITLPFISYGGSSMLVSLLSMGILLSISRDQVNRTEKRAEKKKGRSRVPEQIPLIRS